MVEDSDLTTGEAARQAKVSIQTIHNWIDGGRIEAREEHQGNKRVRYVKRASLEAFLRTLPQSAEDKV